MESKPNPGRAAPSGLSMFGSRLFREHQSRYSPCDPHASRVLYWTPLLPIPSPDVTALKSPAHCFFFICRLFTMNGHLLDNPKDLQDNHFYVAAGLETFKNFPYWKSPKVPSEVQQ